MKGQRVAILDGSCSLYPSPDSAKSPPESNTDSQDSLQHIPQFSSIITEVVKAALVAGDIRPGKIARVDKGVVCECSAVRRLARAIHTRVAEALAVSDNKADVVMLGPTNTS